MAWDVEVTDEFKDWFDTLSDADQDAVGAAVEILAEEGPSLGRPFVDTLRGSRHANMKELRPRASSIRVLFAFDPRRTAILLLGGDKRDQWQAFYRDAIPRADDLYDEHLRTLKSEGLLP
jgi:hypothetical protein